MKSIIIKSGVMMMALLPLFTACQSEPEVGDTLYPVEQENYDARVYINEVAAPGNAVVFDVIQTPVEMLMPEGNVSFYVRLTKPVEGDVTVTVAEDAEAAAAYDGNATALAPGTLSFSNTSVTIPSGSTVSTLPIEATVVASDALASVESKAVVAVKLVSSTNGVAIGSTNNVYYVCFDKTFTNMKSQSTSDLAQLTQIPNTEMSVTVVGYEEYDLSDIIDGDTSTDLWYWGDGIDATILEFDTPQPVAAVSFVAASRYTGYAPKVVDILTSNDGSTWESQTGGSYTSSITPSRNSLEVPFVFYSGITCKYVKVIFHETVWSVGYGSYYNYPCITELKVYK